MLQLRLKEVNICQISKTIGRYNIIANITNNVVTLYSKVPDELLSELCNNSHTIQNFNDEHEFNQGGEKITQKESKKEVTITQKNIEKYDLRYPIVKRGEVYLCDYGKPYGSEQGYKRYAIIVQNDYGNIYSPTTIVISCSTASKQKSPVHYCFKFSNENMIDYNMSHVSNKQNVVMAEQIRTVDKTRLRDFLGTMTPKFMDKVQEIIDISLNLSRGEKEFAMEEIIETDRNLNLNIIQMHLLSFVDANELLNISRSEESCKIRVKKILNLFGFDMSKNGAQYLLQAITISLSERYFNLNTLCKNISEAEKDIDKKEIQRLIVSVVKEKFKLIKSPVIDFISLVHIYLNSNKRCKMKFRIGALKQGSIIDIIKEISQISCRFLFDIENEFVTVENIDDTMVDSTIELIDKYYTILGVDIDNTI